jgi:hypothetical protein
VVKERKPNPIPNNKPFPKGVSGNPNGRPKMPDLKEALAKTLSEPADKDGRTALDVTLEALRAKAMGGDAKATELLFGYAFGKPKQSMDVDHTSGGQPIPSSITVELVPVAPSKP